MPASQLSFVQVRPSFIWTSRWPEWCTPAPCTAMQVGVKWDVMYLPVSLLSSCNTWAHSTEVAAVALIRFG